MLSGNPEERIEALKHLINNFQLISDKKKAWDDVHSLTFDIDPDVRWSSTVFICSCFPNIPDINKALEDLHRLVSDEDVSVRWGAAYTIISIFSQIPDKNKFWKDIIKLTVDENDIMQGGAASSLGSIFMYVPNKLKAWEDLHNLVFHGDFQVRRGIAFSLGRAFPFVPNEYEASKDLQILMHDYFCDVRSFAAYSIGSIFPYVPDKKCAWQELIKLKENEENEVRSSTNHSLGRICIFKASQAETDKEYEKELKNAITFFEQAFINSRFINPSKFCLPFYRSFYTIVFNEEKQTQNEIEKYLTEAKNAITGSNNKKLLFDAVENLANALKEIQTLENMDLEAKKGELNFYRKYCEQAAELMRNTEEAAPFATATMRKGLSILDRKLKSLLEEIQEKAKTACRESQGTDTEVIACAVKEEVQKWEIRSQEEMTWYVENLIFTLESTIPKIPKNQHVFDRICQIREERDVIKQYSIVCTIIPMIPHLSMDERIGSLEAKVDAIYEGIRELVICTKPGISEEIVITTGFQFAGSGAQHVVTIPLQDISYFELKEDLGKIRGKTIDKLSKLPDRLAKKVKGYLLLNDREDVLEQLS